MELNLVEGGQSQRLLYDRSLYDFGKLQLPADLGDLGFSGVRILSGGSSDGWKDAAIFQGATFFRSLARGQLYGVSARGLSIRTGDPQGEEFPLFRALWIEKPSPAADALVIHALLDSTSLTGAFRFTLHAGDATIIDTELTLFARVAVDHVGLGSMAGMYLLGGLDHRRSDDVRQNVYDVTGLQILTGAGEWIWRPVANRETLQISAFSDQNPRGFGLLQRNRNFDSFGDDDAHWELRPSLWIEPIGDWGDGEVMLLEIPSDSENNDNIIAQWRPKSGIKQGGSVSYAYRQFWCWTPPAHSDGAIVMNSRMGKVGKRWRFVVEFVSDQFADPQKAAEVSPAIDANPGQIVSIHAYPYKDRHSIRVVFDLDPGEGVAWPQMIAAARDEFASLLGVSGEPLLTCVRRWPDSMPQYAVGHLARVAEIEIRDERGEEGPAAWIRSIGVADGIELNAAVGGDGPALVLLHGFPETHLMWRHVAPILAEHHTGSALTFAATAPAASRPRSTRTLTRSGRWRPTSSAWPMHSTSPSSRSLGTTAVRW